MFINKNIVKKSIEFQVDGQFLFTSIVSNKSKIQIHKKSQLGKTLMEILDSGKKLEAKS